MNPSQRIYTCILLCLTLNLSCASATTVLKNMDTKAFTFHFASIDEAKKLLTTEDEYTAAWSQFDIDSKTSKAGNTRDGFFEHIAAQALGWTDEEKLRLTESIERIQKSITDQKLTFQLDSPISIIKTTSNEEGGAAGYTRSNFIVLSEKVFDMPQERLDFLLTHELFHVISRAKSELREKLYRVIGFHMMNDVAYPEAIADYRITNPDATQTDSYINLTVGEKPVKGMMILYANRPYEGGSFFQYLNIGFLELEGDDNLKPSSNSEGPVIYSMEKVTGFHEQIGGNTKYIIHPEEIMADNFSLAILGGEMNNPEIVEKVKAILKM